MDNPNYTTEHRKGQHLLNEERTENFSDNARGDSCMILSIGKTDGSMKLVSLERGMGVPILDGRYNG